MLVTLTDLFPSLRAVPEPDVNGRGTRCPLRTKGADPRATGLARPVGAKGQPRATVAKGLFSEPARA